MENSRTKYEMQNVIVQEEKKSVLELFDDFYRQMRGTALSEAQIEAMKRIVEAAGGDAE